MDGVRFAIDIPVDLLHEIDEIVGPRRRNKYIVDTMSRAVELELKERKCQAATVNSPKVQSRRSQKHG